METKDPKALLIMKSAPNMDKRAEKFLNTIARNVKKERIDTLIDQKEKLEDEIESLLDFSLHTDLNKGQQPLTREDCEKRFDKAISLGYELKLISMELKIKRALYADYFGTEALNRDTEDDDDSLNGESI